MIGLVTLLTALAVEGQRGRQRSQELQGRLGLRRTPARRRSDIRSRLDWAMKTYPGAQMWLTLLFSRGNTPLWPSSGVHTYNNRPVPHGLRLEHQHQYRREWQNEFPSLAQGGPTRVGEVWPLPGATEHDLELLIPWLARQFASEDADQIYNDLRSVIWDKAKFDHYRDIVYNQAEENDYQTPWDQTDEYMEHFEENEPDTRWSFRGSRKADTLRDPYLEDLRRPDDPAELKDDVWDGDLDVESVPIATMTMRFEEVEDRGSNLPSGYPRYVTRRLVPIIRVSDPEDDSAWLEFSLSKQAGHSRLFRYDPKKWNLTALGDFDGVGGDAGAEELIAWHEHVREDLTQQPESLERLRQGWLPELKTLFPPEHYDLEDDLTDEERTVRIGLRQVAQFSPEDMAAAWQLVWLIDSATAWILRLDQLYDAILTPFFRLIRDEVGISGIGPLMTGGGWRGDTPRSLDQAFEWARDKHRERMEANWWAEKEKETRGGEPLPLLSADRVLWRWEDGDTIVELTSGESLTREGEAMNHCVGSHADHVRSGRRRVFSYRDAENRPLATWEVQNVEGFPGSDMQGYGNRSLPDRELLRDRIAAFLQELRGSSAMSGQERERLLDRDVIDPDEALEGLERVESLSGGVR